MILVDISSIIHRMLYTSIKNIKPQKIDGVYDTSEFINFLSHLIMRELFDIQIQFSGEYGAVHICVDNSTNAGYWRRDILNTYKSTRKATREKSEINFEAVFVKVTELIDQINLNSPWKVITVPRAEADDIMLVLAKLYSPEEKILIHSPDKDMLQAQRHPNVFQYSSITKKWLIPENKADNLEMWVKEHCVLGDVSDGIPKITDGTEFSDSFILYLKKNGYEVTPFEFITMNIPTSQKVDLIKNYDIYKFNRKGENTGVKDVYKRTSFGPVALKKAIEKHGSIDAWLDSHPLYRVNYERNYKLIMEEGIPDYIRDEIEICFKKAKTDYNMKEFELFLKTNGLNSIIMELANVFKNDHKLCAADFDW